MLLSELTLAPNVDNIRTSYPDEPSCDKYLSQKRWSDKITSPFDIDSKVYECRGGRYRCKNTKKYFNVRTKTLFHNSKVPLTIWFQAIWIIANHSKITSVALAEELGLTQKTAWFMLRRINRYLVQSGLKQKDKPVFTRKVQEPTSDHRLPLSEWLGLLKKQ